MEQEIYFKVLFYFKTYFVFTKWENYYIVGPLCYKVGQVKGSDYYKVGHSWHSSLLIGLMQLEN